MDYTQTLMRINSALRRSDARSWGYYFKTIHPEYGTLLTLTPSSDTVEKTALLLAEDVHLKERGEPSHVLITIIISDWMIVNRSSEEGIVDLVPPIKRHLMDLYEAGITKLKPLYLGFGGGRITKARNGAVLFGVGHDPLFSYRVIKPGTEGYGGEKMVHYREMEIFIEFARPLMNMELSPDYEKDSNGLLSIALGLLPKAAGLLRKTGHPVRRVR